MKLPVRLHAIRYLSLMMSCIYIHGKIQLNILQQNCRIPLRKQAKVISDNTNKERGGSRFSKLVPQQWKIIKILR